MRTIITDAQTHRQTVRVVGREGGGAGVGETGSRVASQKKYLRTCTSILRPSTTVPCNFSLALSASTLCSNVTNPNPCMQERKRRGLESGGGRGEGVGGGEEHIIFVKMHIRKYFTVQTVIAFWLQFIRRFKQMKHIGNVASH